MLHLTKPNVSYGILKGNINLINLKYVLLEPKNIFDAFHAFIPIICLLH